MRSALTGLSPSEQPGEFRSRLSVHGWMKRALPIQENGGFFVACFHTCNERNQCS